MAQSERRTRDETILGFSGLVRSIARRYAGRGFPLDGLVQVGYLGLIQAVDPFDPSRGTSLRAYAARTIDGEIMHMFRDQKWAVRIPRGLQEASTRVATLRAELIHELGREPTVEEIAETAGLTLAEATEAIDVRLAFTTRAMPGTGTRPTPTRTAGRTRSSRARSTDSPRRSTASRSPRPWARCRCESGGSSRCASTATSPSRRSPTGSA
jgi:RNA polymerase sigma factor (sigma-70 family)